MSAEQRDALSWWERRALDLGLIEEFSDEDEHIVEGDASTLAGLGVTVEKVS